MKKSVQQMLKFSAACSLKRSWQFVLLRIMSVHSLRFRKVSQTLTHLGMKSKKIHVMKQSSLFDDTMVYNSFNYKIFLFTPMTSIQIVF